MYIGYLIDGEKKKKIEYKFCGINLQYHIFIIIYISTSFSMEQFINFISS